MFPLFAATPLLKVPILLGHAICTYHGMTPPKVAPLPKDRLTTGPDFLRWMPALQKAGTRLAKVVLISLSLSEIGVLVAQQSPANSFLRHHISAALAVAHLDIDTVAVRLTSMAPLGCVLGIAGGLIRVWCHRTLGKFFTWEIGVRDDHALVTIGPYSIVRHPSYAGWLALFGGNLLLLWGSGSFAQESGILKSALGKIVAGVVTAHLTWVTAGLLFRTKTEDEMLRREFGTQWEQWAAETRYRVVPFVY